MRKRVNESWKIKACVELMVPCVQNFFTDRYPITQRQKGNKLSFVNIRVELHQHIRTWKTLQDFTQKLK